MKQYVDMFFQMSDKTSKSEENVKKITKRTARINYKRCSRCGGRKKEEDMSRDDICMECMIKAGEKKDDKFCKNSTSTKFYFKNSSSKKYTHP